MTNGGERAQLSRSCPGSCLVYDQNGIPSACVLLAKLQSSDFCYVGHRLWHEVRPLDLKHAQLIDTHLLYTVTVPGCPL